MTILSELVAHAFNVKLRVTVKGIRRKKSLVPANVTGIITV
jgi:hypothetical protein